MKAALRKGEIVDYVDVKKPARTLAKPIWHLVQVSGDLDRDRVEFLKSLRIEFYQPLLRRLQPVPRNKLSHSQRRSAIKQVREKLEPFFPGYAFVDYSNAGDHWREIFKITHIRGLVCTNNLPFKVPPKLIAEIQAREVDGAVPAATKLFELPFVLGENVRVSSGPFASFPGTIEKLPTYDPKELGNVSLDELDDSLRVHLLVNIFGRLTPVALSLSDIEKL
jgi:transcriptional antiterminator NusG